MSVTIKDIAKEAGVSVATVSYVLNGTGKVSDEMKRTVRKICEKHNYTPRARKGSTKSQVMKTVIVVYRAMASDQVFSAYESTIIAGCEQALNSAGYRISLLRYADDEELLQRISVEKPVGCILMSVPEVSLPVPVVAIANKSKSVEADFIRVDDERIGELAVEQLVATGAKNLAFVNSIVGHPAFDYRAKIFEQTAPKFGACATLFGPADNYHALMNEMVETVKRGDVDGVFVPGSDPHVIAAATALMQAGLTLGKDVHLVGCCNNAENYTLLRADITKLDMNIAEMGYAAVETLLWRLNRSEAPCRRVLIQPVIS